MTPGPPTRPPDGAGRPDLVTTPVLPVRSQDETDVGWSEQHDLDDDRLLRDRPPHWESD